MGIESIEKQKTSALALSGGGYRAALFALGSLWRLNEFGILRKLDRITAVSGGSITLGHLALHWSDLEFDDHDVAKNFEEVVVKPLQKFCGEPLDVKAGIIGLLTPWKTIGDKITEAYDDKLFDRALLKELPHGKGIPEFIFYATNYGTGSSVRMTQDHIYDYKLGEAPSGDLSLARAVAASSSFPPIFSPVILDSSKWNWKRTDHSDLHDNRALRDRLVLADGGLYDNLGVEAIWKDEEESSDHFDQVFVCNAGAPFKVGFDMKGGPLSTLIQKIGLKRNWITQFSRMTTIMINQQRAVRKRYLMTNTKYGAYRVAYWAIPTNISKYDVENRLASDTPTTKCIAEIPTRLKAFSHEEQGHLINWGYALTDAAVRCYIDSDLKRAERVPLPDHPLG
ncbi:MAG: patatin-like phospholipase family protein [Campylobacterota bacterium]|nr:patatin-like phospholipase family protein [Campylobacterota bacterium]